MTRRTPGFQSERLRQAREARGVSVTALADAAQVSRQAIYQYERGPQTPRPQVLARLARALEVPDTFFFVPVAGQVGEPIFYRSMTSATKSSRARAERDFEWLLEIHDYVGEFIQLPEIDLPAALDVPAKGIDGEVIERAASAVRERWNLGTAPVTDLVGRLEAAGIVVARFHLAAKRLDAFSQWHPDHGRPFVVLNADKASAVRSRFDTAHELGHMILHRLRVPNAFLRDRALFALIEKQAHRFAGALLFPAGAFRQELREPSLEALLALKRRWGMSVQAMLHRASELGMFDDRVINALWRQLARRRWRTTEPLDDEIPVEKPTLLRESLERLLDSGVQTRRDVQDRLPIPRQDVERLCGLDSGFLEDKNVARVRLKPHVRTAADGGAPCDG